MRHGLLVITLGSLLMLISCKPTVHGSGKLVEKNFTLDGFTGIQVGNTFRVNAKMAPGYSVKVQIDDNLEKYLKVKVKDKTLVLAMDNSNQYDVDDDSMVVEVQSPKLNHLALSGAAIGSITGFSSEKFSLDLSGATKLSGDIKADILSVEASGASIIELSGRTGQYKLDLSGASKAHLRKLKAAKAQITLSGASDTEVYVTDELSLDASGACTLKYLGKPKLKSIRTSGASTIKSLEPSENHQSK